MLPLSEVTASQPLHLIPNLFKFPSLGPRQQDDTLFSSLGTLFSEHSFPHDGVVLFFFWFHLFSVLFLCSQQAPTPYAIQHYFKENCFASLLERSSGFFPFMPIIL